MKFLRFLLSFGFSTLLVLGLVGVWYFNEFIQTPLDIPAEGRVILVKEGSSLKRLALELEQAGLVRHGLLLYAYARFNDQAEGIKAGEYQLTPGLKPAQLLEKLRKGEVIQYRFTFIEGWTFKDVLAALASQEALVHQLAGLDKEEIMERLGHAGVHPEGRFFPDSYDFTRGATDISILERAWKKMDAALQQAWDKRAEGISIKSPEEALIMASIIEKETGVGAERPEISGVFDRRLKKKMRLQTDPTVIYGMGEDYEGNIRKKDLQTDTPYNTYTRHGLPPTPICMPGQAALDAAVRPAPGESLYFVAKGDGSHVFTNSYKEHQNAVRKYQLKKDP